MTPTEATAETLRLRACIRELKNSPHAERWKAKHQGEIDALPAEERAEIEKHWSDTRAALLRRYLDTVTPPLTDADDRSDAA